MAMTNDNRLMICKGTTMNQRYVFCALLVMANLLSSSFGAAPTAPEPAGKSKRIPWNDSKVVGSPEPPLPYRVEKAYIQLELFQPVFIRPEPGRERMFLVDHKGSWAGPGGIRVFDDRPDVKTSEPLLHMDRLIYGFCFHPKYRENGYLFVISNGPVKATNKQNRISRFTVDRKPPHLLVEGSEHVILEWDSNGHNGGDLAFGPDGYLYCPTGDGTSDSDTLATGQGLDDLLAVLLRLDVDHPADGKNYSIPRDNPFVNVPAARPEIWAYGFRNPWRMDYDHASNQLWVAQNGQDLWEQVYFVRKGENYGWSVQEGGHPFYLERPRGPQPITPPAADHPHLESRSLTGGVVYRGDKLPELNGAYIYGDFSTGKIWGIKHDGTKVTYQRELADTTLQIVGFSNDRAGNLLVVDHVGAIYHLVPTPPQTTPSNFPRKLSETGLFNSVAKHAMHPGVIPYSVNAQLWSDGAHKARWLAVPGDKQIEYRPNRGWQFPDESVLVKSFSLEREAGKAATRRWIETRLMVKQEGEWVGYSYRWNDEQTDAELVERNGQDVTFEIRDPAAPGGVRKQAWHYPSRTECMVCHSRAANYVLGLSEAQMDRVHDYGDIQANQIDLLADLGLFKNKPRPADKRAALVDPYDATQSLDARARSYLHANCSFCHVDAGGGNAAFAIEFQTARDKAKLFDAPPVHTTFNIRDAKVIASGDPERSLLLYRIARRGKGQMPPLASAMVDDPAVKMIREWIGQLTP
jgi:uncharacterized repeat protein (TIGR03806 family)